MEKITWISKWKEDPNSGRVFIPLYVSDGKGADFLVIQRMKSGSFASDWEWKEEIDTWKTIKPEAKDYHDQIIYAFVTEYYLEGLK